MGRLSIAVGSPHPSSRNRPSDIRDLRKPHIRRPGNAKHFSGILRHSMRSVFLHPGLFVRSRNESGMTGSGLFLHRGLFFRSQGKPGMTGRGSSQHRGGITPSIVPETRSAYPHPSSRNRPQRYPGSLKHPAGVVLISRPFSIGPGASPG